MRFLVILVGVVCLALPACAPQPEPEPEAAPEPVFDQAAEEAAIRKANEDRIAVWNAKDEMAYPAFFDKDCTDGLDGGPCEADAFLEATKNTKLSVVKDAGVVFITSDVAILRYTTEDTGSLDADGKPEPPGKGQYARVYVKKDGKWLMATSFFQLIEE
jgi:hypothetical protein